MVKNDKRIIEQMIIRCDRISENIARFGEDYEKFISKDIFRDAVCFNVLCIGELANDLSKETKQEAQFVDWQLISEVWEQIAHEYDDADNESIWRVVICEIPSLKKLCVSQL